MRGFQQIALLSLLLVQSGCVGMPTKPDQMCSEIATFANASNDKLLHSVALTTDWGGAFSPHEPDKIVIASHACNGGNYEPGKRLCQYLMQHTTIELPDSNYRRALGCLGSVSIASATSIVVLEHMDAKYRSFGAQGVKPGVLVGLEFKFGFKDSAPVLKIYSQYQGQ